MTQLTNGLQIAFGPIPPAASGPSVVWLDSSLAGSRFPAHPGRTRVIVDAGTSTPVQEPNAWYYNGVIYLLVNQAGASRLYTATNPAGPYTNRGTVLGGGVGGEAASVVHPSLYVEGENLYLYYITSTSGLTVRCASATMAAFAANPATAWSGVVNVFSKAGGVVPGLTQFGNFSMAKANGVYNLFIEWQGTGSDSWQTGLASASAPTGTFVTRAGVLGSLDPLFTFGTTPTIDTPANHSSLQMLHARSGGSIGPLIYENGLWTTVYHSGPVGATDGGPQSDIYRATSPDLINWEVDLQGWAAHPRQDTRFEIDQLADPFPLNINGVWWCFYTAACNPPNRFVVKACPLSPTMRISDGSNWVAIDQDPAPMQQRGLIRRARNNDTSAPIMPFELVPVDPANTAAFAQSLPRGGVGMRVAVANISTGTGTIQVSASGTDAILGANPAIDPGRKVEFECVYQNGGNASWVRTT